MITAINMLDCTPYKQSKLSGCKKINFIYGANGSGKSTIGSFLAGDNNPRFVNSAIEWDSELHETIYVYNRKFRRDNFQQTIPGVFTLGSATIEEINELEQMKKTLATKTDDWKVKSESYRIKIEEEIPACEKKFKDNSWNVILKDNESDFQKSFEGVRNSKDKFVIELKNRIAGIPGHEGTVCQRSQLIDRAKTLYAEKLERLELLNLNIQPLMESAEEIRNNPIWNTVIAGNEDIDIAALINDLGNSHWVDQGREYIKNGSNKCPFCQQNTISDSFRSKLEAFFDDEYKRRITLMRSLLERYRTVTNSISVAVEAVLQNEKSVSIGKLNSETYFDKNQLLRSSYIENINLMEKKISEPGLKISISNFASTLNDIEFMITEANKNIELHNRLVNERDKEEEKLRDDVWATLINDAETLITSYKKELSNLNKAANGIKNARDSRKTEIDNLKSEITEKGKNITSVQPTIDEINKSLKAYGFTNFSIQPADGQLNSYCIMRDDGTLAKDTLSEGEETFLSFLYFMQWTKGATSPETVSAKRIIVLDDPISSLDSTILYIVGAMVKDLSYKVRHGTGDVTQLFVLTHNVFFHKEASFIDGQTKELGDVNYWIVHKDDGISDITPYGMKNPISTAYELLWQELRDNENLTRVTIQNTMRRIIENYFGMLGNKKDETLTSCFSEPEESMIARSLISWINDGSHSIPDDLYIDSYTDAVPKYKEVFKRIFYMSGHSAHYNMMMGIEDEMNESGDSLRPKKLEN